MLSERLASTSNLLFRLIGESADDDTSRGGNGSSSSSSSNDVVDGGNEDKEDTFVEDEVDFLNKESSRPLVDDDLLQHEEVYPDVEPTSGDSVRPGEQVESSAMAFVGEEELSSAQLPLEHRTASTALGLLGEELSSEAESTEEQAAIEEEVNRVIQWRPGKRRKVVKNRERDHAAPPPPTYNPYLPRTTSPPTSRRRFQPYLRKYGYRPVGERYRKKEKADEENKSEEEEEEDNSLKTLYRDKVPTRRTRLRTRRPPYSPPTISPHTPHASPTSSSEEKELVDLKPKDLASMSLDELQEVMKLRAGLVKARRKPGTKRLQKEKGSKEGGDGVGDPLQHPLGAAFQEQVFEKEQVFTVNYNIQPDSDHTSSLFPNFPTVSSMTTTAATTTTTRSTTETTTTPTPITTTTTTTTTEFYLPDSTRISFGNRNRNEKTSSILSIPPHITDDVNLLNDMMDLTTFGLKTGIATSFEDDGVSAARPAFPLPPRTHAEESLEDEYYSEEVVDDSKEEFVLTDDKEMTFPHFQTGKDYETSDERNDGSGEIMSTIYTPINKETFIPNHGGEKGKDLMKDLPGYPGILSSAENDVSVPKDHSSTVSVGSKPSGNFMSFSIGSSAESKFETSGSIHQLDPTENSNGATEETGERHSFSLQDSSSYEMMKESDATPGFPATTTRSYDNPYFNYFHPNHRYPSQSLTTTARPKVEFTTEYARPTPFTVRLRRRKTTTTTITTRTTTTTTTTTTTAFTVRPTSTTGPSQPTLSSERPPHKAADLEYQTPFTARPSTSPNYPPRRKFLFPGKKGSKKKYSARTEAHQTRPPTPFTVRPTRRVPKTTRPPFPFLLESAATPRTTPFTAKPPIRRRFRPYQSTSFKRPPRPVQQKKAEYSPPSPARPTLNPYSSPFTARPVPDPAPTEPPFTVPARQTVAPHNYVKPGNIRPSPLSKKKPWVDDEWEEDERRPPPLKDLFNPAVFSSHDVELKEPFGNLPTFFRTSSTPEDVHPTRPSLLNHKYPPATAFTSDAPKFNSLDLRFQSEQKVLDFDYLDELYSDHEEEQDPEKFKQEVATLFKEIGEDGESYGAFGNSFVFNDDDEGEEQGGGDREDGKVIKGYLKNPFGSDFIRLEVDSDRLKHNKTTGVVHVPLVVIDKSMPIHPRGRRRKKRRKNGHRPIPPQIKLGMKPPTKMVRPQPKIPKQVHEKQQSIRQQQQQHRLQKHKQLNQDPKQLQQKQAKRWQQLRRPQHKLLQQLQQQQQMRRQQQKQLEKHKQKQQERKQKHQKQQQQQQQLRYEQQQKQQLPFKPPPRQFGPGGSLPPHPKDFKGKPPPVRRKQALPRLQQQLHQQQVQLQQLLHSAGPQRMREVVERLPDAIQNLPGLMHKLISGMKAEGPPFIGRDLKGEY